MSFTQLLNRTTAILNTIKRRKLEYLGHAMKNPEKYVTLQLIIQGKIQFKRRRKKNFMASKPKVWKNKPIIIPSSSKFSFV